MEQSNFNDYRVLRINKMPARSIWYRAPKRRAASASPGLSARSRRSPARTALVCWTQRPASNRQGTSAEFFGERPETRKLIRNDRSNLALWAEPPKETAHGYFDRVRLIQRSADFAHDQTLRFFNVRQMID